MLVPSTPMNDETLSTAGSSRSDARERLRLARDIARNDADCGASEMPWIEPVSCSGKKPLGISEVEDRRERQRHQEHDHA